ncbi:MAG TPA: hypothetical protein PLP14_00930 [Chitinophagaceae bacterium]|nr:hypothetical protein [Chitinophagaceae bacterium]
MENNQNKEPGFNVNPRYFRFDARFESGTKHYFLFCIIELPVDTHNIPELDWDNSQGDELNYVWNGEFPYEDPQTVPNPHNYKTVVLPFPPPITDKNKYNRISVRGNGGTIRTEPTPPKSSGVKDDEKHRISRSRSVIEPYVIENANKEGFYYCVVLAQLLKKRIQLLEHTVDPKNRGSMLLNTTDDRVSTQNSVGFLAVESACKFMSSIIPYENVRFLNDLLEEAVEFDYQSCYKL